MSEDVSRRTDPDRFEITTDGQVAGFTQFVEKGDQRIFFHTEIGEEFGGRGLASTLVAAALEATRADGMRIVPVCPYVKKYLGTHHEVDDLVDPVTPDALAAVPKG
ncbi:GNAT family N-acetyltransferase [Janibacter alkaliphilus]|uniref:N-acetyltransferase domain-containing protein n=1 Tax=Janibacter alkaliphilus TaxID=1069963 RepID=A0A852XBH7_9MICO|nr:GNAT family N-acetyltransferase [Janibacter alkaliphilus]NYG38093.1 hypothetical protein [Janibacter alkaliphilus]